MIYHLGAKWGQTLGKVGAGLGGKVGADLGGKVGAGLRGRPYGTGLRGRPYGTGLGGKVGAAAGLGGNVGQAFRPPNLSSMPGIFTMILASRFTA